MAHQKKNGLRGILALLPGTVEHQGCTVEIASAVVVDTTTVAILLIDPRQTLSQTLLRKIQTATLQNHANLRIFICNQRPDVPLSDQASYYMLSNLESVCCHMLGFHACPGLAVVSVPTGHKFSHPQEELGVLWNSPESILSAWMVDQSTCLTPLQRVQANVLFPTMCLIQ